MSCNNYICGGLIGILHRGPLPIAIQMLFLTESMATPLGLSLAYILVFMARVQYFATYSAMLDANVSVHMRGHTLTRTLNHQNTKRS